VLHILRNKGSTKVVHFKPDYVYDIVEAITRNIYLSNIEDMHAIGCLLSIYAVSFDTFRVKGGNRLLYEAMLRGKHVELNTHIVRIEKLPKGFLLETQKGLIKNVNYFDDVVLAAPLPDSQIQLSGFSYERLPRIPFRKLYVTIVYGCINPVYFGLNSELDVPATVLTTNATTIFNSLGIIKNINDTYTVSKIFSQEPMNDGDLDRIYSTRVNTWTHSWDSPGAYPILDAKDNWHLPTKIQGLYYINSMEYWISTQETEAIQAKNIAYQIVTRK
jgi:hypothetical protein